MVIYRSVLPYQKRKNNNLKRRTPFLYKICNDFYICNSIIFFLWYLDLLLWKNTLKKVVLCLHAVVLCFAVLSLIAQCDKITLGSGFNEESAVCVLF